MCIGLHVYRCMNMYVYACMCTCAYMSMHACGMQSTGILLQTVTVSSRAFVSHIIIHGSDWRDEGLGSPRNAVVLPDRSETSQR